MYAYDVYQQLLATYPNACRESLLVNGGVVPTLIGRAAGYA